MKITTTSVRLREIMSLRGLKQVDVLRLAKPFCIKNGVSLGSNDLSQYVTGKVEPGQHKLSVLGMALNVDEAWLMGYDVPMERRNKEQQATSDYETPIKDSTDIKVERFVRDALSNEPENFKRRLIIALSQLGDDAWDVLEQVVDMVAFGEQDTTPLPWAAADGNTTNLAEAQKRYDEAISKDE